MSELKPCPFCGSEARYVEREIGTCEIRIFYDVGCTNKSCFVFEGAEWCFDTQDEAAQKWNTRTDQPTALPWTTEAPTLPGRYSILMENVLVVKTSDGLIADLPIGTRLMLEYSMRDLRKAKWQKVQGPLGPGGA